MYGEAIIFLKEGLDENFKYYRKQGMQLASKMRFIAAQFLGYFENELWRKNAEHANHMAKLLAREIATIKEITITQPVQANGVFAIVPKEIIPILQQEFFFYMWNEETNEVRWMTAWDTQEVDIREFVKLIKSSLSLNI